MAECGYCEIASEDLTNCENEVQDLKNLLENGELIQDVLKQKVGSLERVLEIERHFHARTKEELEACEQEFRKCKTQLTQTQWQVTELANEAQKQIGEYEYDAKVRKNAMQSMGIANQTLRESNRQLLEKIEQLQKQ